MKIVHIVLGKANPNRMNGVNKVVYNLAVNQTKIGLDVAVWGITNSLEKNYEERNFETQLFQKSKNPFGLNSSLKKSILSEKSKSIFHLHGGWIPVFYSLSKFLAQNHIPFVFTPHGAYNRIAMKRSSWVKKMYFQFFEKSLLNNAAKIHCIGKSEVTGLAHIYNNDKAVLLPYGFDCENHTVTKKNSNDDIIFGFIGRLDIYTKGLDVLMKAFSKYKMYDSNAQLWIVGDSDEKSQLEKMVQKYHLSNNVVFFGSKYGIEKNEILQKMDVFVHPSRNEGLPSSVIEAASFGKPCLVTEATNIGDLITKYKAGTNVKNLNSNELFIALKNMKFVWSQKDEFELMGQNAKRMVSETFQWDKVLNDLNNFLYKI